MNDSVFCQSEYACLHQTVNIGEHSCKSCPRKEEITQSV